MSTIAIIDAAIDKERISPRNIEHINLCGDKKRCQGKQLGHGTICAMLLDFCTSNYELINIQIF